MSSLEPSGSVVFLGVECSGKSTLSRQLTQALLNRGESAACVPEQLRHWCEMRHRIPTRSEQWEIMRQQAQAMQDAQQSHRWVLGDTSPIMTAVYSEWAYQDCALWPVALQLHGRLPVLWTQPDLPWQEDPWRIKDPDQRLRIKNILEQRLLASGLPLWRVSGHGQARLDSAALGMQKLLDLDQFSVSLAGTE